MFKSIKMKRALRRYLTEKIAKKRFNRHPEQDVTIGHYRKFNGTCDCHICKLNKPKYKRK